MARPHKKGKYRPIVVDGLQFRWCHEFWYRSFCLVVVLERDTSERGQRLIVERSSDARPERDIPTLDLSIWKAFHRAREDFASEEATPGFVAAVIQFALKHGWTRGECGSDFTIRYYDDGYAEVIS
jgi:hypothetical protein